MNPADLEHSVDRAMKRLPRPPAPPTLLPRVMAAVHALMTKPWYQRAWLTWPVGWRMASCLPVLLVIVAAVIWGPAALAFAEVTAAPVTGPALDRIGPVMHEVERTVNAGRVIWNAVIRPLLLFGAPFVGLMFLLFGTIVVALNRVAFGKAQPS